MEGMYGHQSTAADYADKVLMSPENLTLPSEYYHSLLSSNRFPVFGSDELISAASAISEAASATAGIRRSCSRRDQQVGGGVDDHAHPTVIKAKIASHPLYPKLLHAYIDCQKVGAPPEIASLLDEIGRENDVYNRRDTVSTCVGADPELDEFMETYCDILVKYKSDLSRPFDEATTFLTKIQTQLGNLCKAAYDKNCYRYPTSFLTKIQTQLGNLCKADASVVSSDEEFSGGEMDAQTRSEDLELKDRLLRKFGSHISTLKLEFSKKKKKGKLPKEARQTLLEWWNVHYKWPYPTEADKNLLAESTGLDQKQINNWFINQRKRHWKPSEDMQLAVMDSLSGHYYTDDS